MVKGGKLMTETVGWSEASDQTALQTCQYVQLLVARTPPLQAAILIGLVAGPLSTQGDNTWAMTVVCWQFALNSLIKICTLSGDYPVGKTE